MFSKEQNIKKFLILCQAFQAENVSIILYILSWCSLLDSAAFAKFIWRRWVTPTAECIPSDPANPEQMTSRSVRKFSNDLFEKVRRRFHVTGYKNDRQVPLYILMFANCAVVQCQRCNPRKGCVRWAEQSIAKSKKGRLARDSDSTSWQQSHI